MAKRPSTDRNLSLVIKDPEAEAFQLRLQGLSHSEIAHTGELGYTDAQSVGKAIKTRLDREARMIPEQTRESLIALELARLDYVQAKHWDGVGSNKDDSATVLNCIKLRIQLMQLDAADISAGQTVLVIQGDKDEYIDLLKSAVDN